jgi:DNA invertase Pin-like site-specific DNA recombinase
MSIGKVTVWYMTEEERQAYIKKYPIIPTERPSGATFESVKEQQYAKAMENSAQSRAQRGSILENLNEEKVHKLFISGETIHDIAFALKISVSTLNRFIGEQRKIDPEKWPIRSKGRKKE